MFVKCNDGAQGTTGGVNRPPTLRLMVRRQLVKQCHREDGSDGLPAPNDHDNGPAVINHGVQWTTVSTVGRSSTLHRSHQLALLSSVGTSAGLRQVPRQCFDAREHLASARFVCAHGESDDAAVHGDTEQGVAG